MNVPPPTNVPSPEQPPKADWNRLAATAGCAGVGCGTVGIVVIVSTVLWLLWGRSTSEKPAEPVRTSNSDAGGDVTARWTPHTNGSGLECLYVKRGREWLLGAYCRRWTKKPSEAEIYESTNLQTVVATDRYDDSVYLISVPSQPSFSHAYYVRRSDDEGYVRPIPPVGRPGEGDGLIRYEEYIRRLEAEERNRRETNDEIMSALKNHDFSEKTAEGLSANYRRNEALIERITKELGEVDKLFDGLRERAAIP